MTNIEIIEGADDAQIADSIAARLETMLMVKETLDISVPGGSTPFPIFAELLKRHLGLSQIAVWPNDDRIVPEDHEASNTGKIRALFQPAGARVVALVEDMPVPVFDLMWLGMGADGHIASLFPDTDPQLDDMQTVKVLTPDPLPAHAPFDRITMTLPTLLRAREFLFVIRGEDKRAVLEAAIAGENDLPIARLLRATSRPVTIFT